MNSSFSNVSASAVLRRMSDEDNALSTFRRYTEAFRKLDAKAVAQLFHEPALVMSPRGAVAIASTSDAEQVYSRIMRDAAARGYTTTTFDSVAVRSFGPGQAAVEGRGRWIGTAGEVLHSFELSYVLRLTSNGWKIALASVSATVA